jgi:beta-lactamase superfamily II metal-dependent hydrolase
VIDKPQELSPEAGISLSFLWPEESLAEKKLDNLNNSSIVLKLIYASTSYLFMGDLEDEETLSSTTEARLLKSDVLKVGHHGSTNANSASFLKTVSPRYAIIPVGADNTYGHPHYRTIFNLEKIGAQILRTDQPGDIVVLSDGQKIWLKDK